MPSSFCDTDAITNGTTCQESDAAPYVSYLDLMNAVGPFMMPLTSCDATLVPMVSHEQKVIMYTS